jgi:hypothetical protein
MKTRCGGNANFFDVEESFVSKLPFFLIKQNTSSPLSIFQHQYNMYVCNQAYKLLVTNWGPK